VLQVTLETAEGADEAAASGAVTLLEADARPEADARSGADAIAETDVVGESDEDAEAGEGNEAAVVGAPRQRLGRGVTLEVCSKVSRDLSTALDVLELIDGNYRLEVGSPGLERRLYTLADYRRFSGRLAKLKLASAIEGQYVLLGKLSGVDAEDRVLIVVDGVEHAVTLENVRSGQLAIDWQELGFSPAPRQRAGRRPAAQGRK
jgi:ribosome maturation factor RimP